MSEAATVFTIEELIISRLAREYTGEIAAFGTTICGDIAARLAKRLYQPDIVLVGGNSTAAWDCNVGPKVMSDEFVAMSSARARLDWRMMFGLIARGKAIICLGPVQLDATGNSNLSVVGSWNRPKVQLVGARGIPDGMWGFPRLLYHLRNHSPRTLVDRVDFISGRGTDRAELSGQLTTGLPGVLVTPLGVFDWQTRSGRMRVQSIHPGVDTEEVVRQTGFELEGTAQATTTTPPTLEELDIIRTEIDPLGIRRLEANDVSDGLFSELAVAEEELVDSGRRFAPTVMGSEA